MLRIQSKKKLNLKQTFSVLTNGRFVMQVSFSSMPTAGCTKNQCQIHPSWLLNMVGGNFVIVTGKNQVIYDTLFMIYDTLSQSIIKKVPFLPAIIFSAKKNQDWLLESKRNLKGFVDIISLGPCTL